MPLRVPFLVCRGHAHVLHLVVRPESGAAGREHRPGGLIGASWVECPAFEDDRDRGQTSQEGDATDAEVRQPLGNVGTHERFTVVTIGDKQDRGHQRWIPPWIVVST
jgi:hypothetical protein